MWDKIKQVSIRIFVVSCPSVWLRFVTSADEMSGLNTLASIALASKHQVDGSTVLTVASRTLQASCEKTYDVLLWSANVYMMDMFEQTPLYKKMCPLRHKAKSRALETGHRRGMCAWRTRFGLKMSPIGPIWDKSGTFSDHNSVNFSWVSQSFSRLSGKYIHI